MNVDGKPDTFFFGGDEDRIMDSEYATDPLVDPAHPRPPPPPLPPTPPPPPPPAPPAGVPEQPAEAIPRGLAPDELIELWADHKRDPGTPAARAAEVERAHLLGHYGAKAIVRGLLADGLYWRGMTYQAQQHVAACTQCQRHNIAKTGYHPPRSPQADVPLDHLVIDLIGPMPTSEGNSYIMVVVDIASRFIWLRAIPDKTAPTVASVLITIWADFGWPRILGSDGGSEFANDILKDTCRRLQVEKRLSTPYHPQGNSVAERHVQSTLMQLRKTLNGKESAWAPQLYAAQIALNAQISDVHQSTPFAVMFGRQLNPLGDYSNSPSADGMPPEQARRRMQDATEIVFPAIAEHADKASKRRFKSFMKKHPHAGNKELFPVGSLVMVQNRSRSRKLEQRYEGPYEVLNKTPTSYSTQPVPCSRGTSLLGSSS
eukprot:Lithocolla_globosa_v1_NODE_1885_length_2273_cov_105.862940.p1 type:complete len:430 gc:universal NODE_1885_length_2273_cov_105.862940:1906-617(-)